MCATFCITAIVCFSIFVVDGKVVENSGTKGLEARLKTLKEEEKKEVLELEVYKADTTDKDDVMMLSRWFCMSASVESLGNASEALRKLEEESCNMKVHENESLFQGPLSMCETFEFVQEQPLECVEGLIKAECLAVTMYTSEFYATYNQNIRKGKWAPYKVYTTLLYSALVKLDKLDPLPNNTILYRGMDKEFGIPSSGRIYFKQFVSTSSDRAVAEFFGTGTIIVIVPNVPIVAARIKGLSIYPAEEEILISPFEAFEYINKTGSGLFFKSSKSQDLIENPSLECEDDPGSKAKTKSFHFTVGKSGASKLEFVGIFVSLILALVSQRGVGKNL